MPSGEGLPNPLRITTFAPEVVGIVEHNFAPIVRLGLHKAPMKSTTHSYRFFHKLASIHVHYLPKNSVLLRIHKQHEDSLAQQDLSLPIA